jgi:hypothetical protein
MGRPSAPAVGCRCARRCSTRSLSCRVTTASWSRRQRLHGSTSTTSARANGCLPSAPLACASSDLRNAPHLRDVEPRRRHEHLHARAPDGHERAEDRSHVRSLAQDAEAATAVCWTPTTQPSMTTVGTLWARRSRKRRDRDRWCRRPAVTPGALPLACDGALLPRRTLAGLPYGSRRATALI